MLAKSLIRKLVTNMKAEDLKELASVVTVLSNEKLKAEKEKVKPKKCSNL